MDIKKMEKALGAIHIEGKDHLDTYMKRKAKDVLAWLIFEQKEIDNMKKAVCILVFNEDGEVLAVSRKHDVNDFGLPGGKKEPDETEEEAVAREMREETGLEISNIRKVFQHSAEREYWTSCWTGDITGNIHTDEEGAVRWVRPDVLFKGSFGEYNRKLFEALDLENIYT